MPMGPPEGPPMPPQPTHYAKGRVGIHYALPAHPSLIARYPFSTCLLISLFLPRTHAQGFHADSQSKPRLPDAVRFVVSPTVAPKLSEQATRVRLCPKAAPSFLYACLHSRILSHNCKRGGNMRRGIFRHSVAHICLKALC